MPIFSKPNAIVYVRRSGLIIAGKKLTPARYTFSSEHIENLELTDTAAFTDALRDFFVAHSIKGKHALMVLDDSVIFTKSVTNNSKEAHSEHPAKVADAFIAQMPLHPGQRACLRVLHESDLSLYGTNGELYVAITDALNQAGAAKVVAITPAAAYPSESGKQQLAAAVQQYVNDTTVRSIANFQHVALV